MGEGATASFTLVSGLPLLLCIGLFAQIGCLKQHIIRLSCSVSQETHCFPSCQVVMLFLQRMLELGGHFPLDVF